MLVTPDIDASLDEQRLKAAFWRAFRRLGRVVRQHAAVLMPARRLAPAYAAGALIVLWGFFSSALPALAVRTDIVVSAALVLSLAGVFVWGMLPLRAIGRRLPLVALAALPPAVLFVWLGLVPLANVAKIVFAASLGIWVAQELEQVSWVVLVALISAVVDVASVFAGPTKAILAKGPVVVGYFTVAVTWLGYTYNEAFTALGVSDMIFFALYLGAARRFGLRARVERCGDGGLVRADDRRSHVVDGPARLAAALGRLSRGQRRSLVAQDTCTARGARLEIERMGAARVRAASRPG